MRIEHISTLEFFEENLIYKGKSYRYDEIDGVSFRAAEIQHQVNFVPAGKSYASELDLRLTNDGKLRIRQEWAILGKSQKARMEAVWRAKEVLSERAL